MCTPPLSPSHQPAYAPASCEKSKLFGQFFVGRARLALALALALAKVANKLNKHSAPPNPLCLPAWAQPPRKVLTAV